MVALLGLGLWSWAPAGAQPIADAAADVLSMILMKGATQIP